MRRTEGDRFIISRISHLVVLVCTLFSCVILFVMMSGISAPMYVLARQVLVILSILAIVAVLLTAKGADLAAIRREEIAVKVLKKRIVILLLAMAAIVGLMIAASFGGDWRLDAIIFVLVFVNVGMFLLLILLPR